MISFEQFKDAVNELYSMGKLEIFKDKDEHSHECLSLYLYSDSIDIKKIKIVEKLKPEYWNIIPRNEKLQIYISIVHVNIKLSELNEWLNDNLYIEVGNMSRKD